MHACMLVVGIVLSAQVTGGSGARYPSEDHSGKPTSTPQRPLWGNQAGSPQRDAVAPPSTQRPQPTNPPQRRLADPENAGDPRSPAAADPTGGNRYGPSPTTPLSTVPNNTTPAQPHHEADNTAADSNPANLMRTLLKPSVHGQLTGAPLSLVDVLRGARTRAEQTQRVEAYWDLSAAVADYYLAVRETTELATLRASVSQPSAHWEQARQSLDARAQVARRSARAAQYHLQHLLRRTEDSLLPLPRDLPHCGAYNTRYDEIFSNRRSREALQLHELLPLRYRDLQNQARGVTAAREWLDTVSQRRNPQTDGTGLLKAHELLILRRRAFVYTVRDYNMKIARYTELASPGEVAADRLVAMLIRVSSEGSATWNRPGIKRLSAEQSANAPNSAQRRKKTFANSDWNQARRIPTTSDGTEHSILVHP